MILTETIPASLIFEELDGRPLYRKGYKKVLENNLSPEEVMGCSFLQGLIVRIISTYFAQMLQRNGYWVLTNEPGLHVSHGNNLTNDVAVFDKALIKNVFSKNYPDVPPKIAIEVDVKIEAGQFPSPEDYFFRKSEKMIGFGTERVIWVLTESRKIMVMDRSRKWTVYEWDEMVPVFDQYQFCLNDLLKEEGVI
ncbi:Uma2 family endonuclease [Dyadobacter fermentans]|uniref:Uma2 family endonuclease n=1 Tax=Dyadobacter fermentans TaxID=94254 RepID=UPI001CC0C35E|nr:Uma2 family endonuclease [Dyadobacter fermentans]MBZ1362835.1 Uma2 family endonuclease [Dyadobacter fermentans]